MSEQEKLLPCPFCGGAVKLEKTIDGRTWWGVVCRNTKNVGGSCAIEQRPSASEDAAINRWNARASAPAVEAPRDDSMITCVRCGSPKEDSEAVVKAIDYLALAAPPSNETMKAIRTVRAALQPSATQPDNNHMMGLRILEQAVVQKEHILPYDVQLGAGTFRKGVSLDTFVKAAQRAHKLAMRAEYAGMNTPKIVNPDGTLEAPTHHSAEVSNMVEEARKEGIRKGLEMAATYVESIREYGFNHLSEAIRAMIEKEG